MAYEFILTFQFNRIRYNPSLKLIFYFLQSRLAVNSVTAGDYGRPHKLAKFVGELDSGFRLLNLKNDSLRKRFDGLKYDLKKIEEVLYDITIRGLSPKQDIVEKSSDTTTEQNAS